MVVAVMRSSPCPPSTPRPLFVAAVGRHGAVSTRPDRAFWSVEGLGVSAASSPGSVRARLYGAVACCFVVWHALLSLGCGGGLGRPMGLTLSW